MQDRHAVRKYTVYIFIYYISFFLTSLRISSIHDFKTVFQLMLIHLCDVNHLVTTNEYFLAKADDWRHH